MFQPNVEIDQHTVHNSRISAAKSDRIESQYSSNDRDSELRVARPPKRCTLKHYRMTRIKAAEQMNSSKSMGRQEITVMADEGGC
jgi:hypothetical protein